VTSCSIDALAAHEPLAGTAPIAGTWIVIEQPGPWGRDVLADSGLAADLREHLSGAKALGMSVILARHPDRPGRVGSPDRHVWVARSAPGGMLLRHALLADLGEIGDWDLPAVAAGSLPAVGTVEATPVMFICTHSGRDRCCAVHGRALMTAVLDRTAPEDRERVWECSHLGGHRFAPVSLTLPSGAVHGRLDVGSALAVLATADRGEVVLDHLRGRSSLVAPFQVAAIEVQRRHGISGFDDLDVLRLVDDRAVPMLPGALLDPGNALLRAEVRHADGRAWRAALVARDLDRPRLESCGKDPVPGVTWVCTELEQTTPWN
jgi:hypothetical protein